MKNIHKLPVFHLGICFFLFLTVSKSGAVEPIDKQSPVTFIENSGQWQKEILFKGNFTSTHVTFLRNGISFAQPGEEVHNPDGSEDYPYIVWNMKFADYSSKVKVTGAQGKESVVSYLSGNDPAKWVIHPTQYSLLEYRSVFKNIDLNFYGS